MLHQTHQATHSDLFPSLSPLSPALSPRNPDPNPQDFSDEEIRKLEEQWDKEDGVDEEDLPPHLRPRPPPPPFDPNNIDMNVSPVAQEAQLHAHARLCAKTTHRVHA